MLYSYYTGHDPVAQTFTVNSDGGAMVTSVDLYFSEAGNRPVTIELRTTNQGVPSTKIIPFSAVTKTPQEISVSDTGATATTFVFEAPIYLMEGETYALIVKTDEPGCKFFISEVGQTDTITGNVITSQPLTGSLYLSQNSLEFEINPLFDMKFNLRKAVYNTNSVTVDLKTSLPEAMTLQTNPFTMATGTNKVRVNARNHGFRANEVVVISNVADGVYGADGTNGVPSDLLNGQHTVTATGLDKDSFIIEIETQDGNGESLLVGSLSDLVRGDYGGSDIIMSRQLSMDMMYLKSGSVAVKGTDIAYSINHESFGVNSFRPIVGDANYMFDSRQTILSYENQTITSSSPLVKRSSLRVRATLTSDNSNVSPVLDLQKGAAYIVSNLVNNAQENDVNVLELDATDLLTPALESLTVNDTIGAGEGTATVTLGDTALSISASGDDITWMADVGDYILDSSGTFVGEIASINNAISITLVAGAAIALSNEAFQIQNNNHVKFYNLGGKGIIETSLDTADNLLGNANIGKWLYISNLDAGLNGYHQIENILIENAEPNRPGNIDGDRITITLAAEFSIPSLVRLNIVSDETNNGPVTNYAIQQLDKYVEDYAPNGTYNYANYITRPLYLNEPADSIKILFDAEIPVSTDIKVYYRTGSGTEDIHAKTFTNTGFINSTVNPEGEFTQREIDLVDIDPYNKVVIKIAMKSNNYVNTPKIRNLRLIAYS
jgi:hypothetical protein